MPDALLMTYGLTVLCAGILCLFAGVSYRRGESPGILAFSTYLGILGLGTILSIAAHLLLGPIEIDNAEISAIPLWSITALLPLALGAVAWIVFALQYTGQYTQLHSKHIGLLSVPACGVLPIVVESIVGDPIDAPVIEVMTSVGLLYTLALYIVGMYLVVRTTHRYGHLSVVQGICLSVPPFVLFFVLNLTRTIIIGWGEIVAMAIYALGYLIAAGAIAIALHAYETFESPPAIGAIGERAIAREIDDLLFVLDHRERVITLNGTATATLDLNGVEPLGERLKTVLGHSVAELDARDTIELRTDSGHPKFDPQVSLLTDQHDRHLGSIVSLRDVTNRELRQERLTVLNRVLRHNHRNQIDVIRANAEEIAHGGSNEHAASIIQSTEKLSELSQAAREIDHFLSRPVDDRELDLAAAIEGLLASHESADITLAYHGPDEISVSADPEAIDLILENAIEQAVNNAESTVDITVTRDDGITCIEVANDGAAIPDGERKALTAGTELPLRHGRGLGLWLVKWGVTKLNGTVTFELADGTGIRIELPERST